MKSGYSWSELVEMAIQVEKAGEKFYRSAAGKNEGRSADLFRELADAERVHAEIFSSLLPEGFAEGTKGIDAEEAKDYIGAVVGDALLKYLEGSEAASLGSGKDILEFALGFEKESLNFYASLRDYVTDATGPVIERIIAEENKHIARIQGMLADL
jgi:rubrerythrin